MDRPPVNAQIGTVNSKFGMALSGVAALTSRFPRRAARVQGLETAIAADANDDARAPRKQGGRARPIATCFWRLARHRGWTVVRVVREVASGAAKRALRDERVVAYDFSR